jgi:hypothetical protein
MASSLAEVLESSLWNVFDGSAFREPAFSLQINLFYFYNEKRLCIPFILIAE